MFACIYFMEDATLSVVGQNNKGLVLNGSFEVKETVSMKWGKKIYNGVIVKVQENEEDLAVFATKAYNKLLKNLTEKPTEVPESLFSFSLDTKIHQKRNRIRTDKIKESEEQNESFSPKKQKKLQKVHVPECNTQKKTTVSSDPTPSQKKSEKKKLEECSSLQSSILMVNMMDQFQISSSTKITGNVTEPKPGPSETERRTVNQESNIDTDYHSQDNFSSPSERPDNPVTVSKTKTPQKELCSETSNGTEHASTSVSSPMTSFLDTWSLCTESLNVNDTVTHQHDKIPVPPPEVLAFIRVFGRPDVQHFFKKIADHFDHSSCSHQNNDCFEGKQNLTFATDPPKRVRDVLHATSTGINMGQFCFILSNQKDRMLVCNPQHQQYGYQESTMFRDQFIAPSIADDFQHTEAENMRGENEINTCAGSLQDISMPLRRSPRKREPTPKPILDLQKTNTSENDYPERAVESNTEKQNEKSTQKEPLLKTYEDQSSLVRTKLEVQLLLQGNPANQDIPCAIIYY